MQVNIKTYDVSKDSEDHLQVSASLITVEIWNYTECYHMFMQTWLDLYDCGLVTFQKEASHLSPTFIEAS